MRSLLVVLVLIGPAAPVEAREVRSPAGPGGVHPFLTAGPDGRLLMVWTEPAGNQHAVKVAWYSGGRWSEARTVVRRPDLFVNWADFPSAAVTADGTLFVHWLQKSGPATYAYDVWMATSRDDGKTWRNARVIHDDGTPTEHGFVSMVPIRDDAVGVVWLDGRQMKGEHHGGEMTLRYTRVDRNGRLAGEAVLDRRVCECCSTGMAVAKGGPLVAYRDRSPEEIRDISAVRWNRKRWTAPAAVHADGWKIEGCPVNGPQVEARGDLVVVSWFTAARDEQRVFIAFSNDGGATFRAPVRVDEGKPTGRVDLLLLEDKSALVTWIDGLGDEAHIALRRIRPDGRRGPIEKLAVSSTARGAGFPRMAVAGRELFVAWTEPSTPRRIRVIALPLPR